MPVLDIMHFPLRAYQHLNELERSLQIIPFFLQEHVIAKTKSHASAFIDPEIKPCLEKASFMQLQENQNASLITLT